MKRTHRWVAAALGAAVLVAGCGTGQVVSDEEAQAQYPSPGVGAVAGRW